MFAFYFSQSEADQPCDGKKRKFPTRLAYIPAEKIVIAYTLSEMYEGGLPCTGNDDRKLVISGVKAFALLRDNTRINPPDVWRKFLETEEEAFRNALDAHNLTPEALLDAWNDPNARKKRAMGSTAGCRKPGDHYTPIGNANKFNNTR